MKFLRESGILGTWVRAMMFIFALFLILEHVESRPGGGSSSRSRSSSRSSSSRSSSSSSSRKSSSSSSSRKSSSSSSSRKSSSPRSSSSSSSSGGYSSSSSEDGDVGDALAALIVLFVFGVVIIVILVVVVGGISKLAGLSNRAIVVHNIQKELAAKQAARQKITKAELLAQDPNFSEQLLLDYLQNLFHEFYMRGHDRVGLQALAPFMQTPIPLNHPHSEVVINAMNPLEFYRYQENGENYIGIDFFLDTNFTALAANSKRRVLSEQIWTLSRLEGVKSLPPQKMQALVCPNCAAPNTFETSKSCSACGTRVEPARLTWALSKRVVEYEDSYASDNLVSYEEEKGTNFPTIFSPNLRHMKGLFAQTHQLDTDAYFNGVFIEEVAKPTFLTVYKAWESKRWSEARHLLSDFLYQTQNFWMEEYRSKGYTNKLDDLQIQRVQLAKIDMDAFYESFTVRIYAACKDYTIEDKTGKVIGGDPHNLRQYSEYWTFIRRIGQEKPAKDSFDLKSCPACSAPLDKMGMAGICGYCDNKVTTGEFSWVLSRITQDEAYEG